MKFREPATDLHSGNNHSSVILRYSDDQSPAVQNKKLTTGLNFEQAKQLAIESANETSRRRLEKFQQEKNNRILEVLSTKLTGTQEYIKKAKSKENKRYTELQIGKMSQ